MREELAVPDFYVGAEVLLTLPLCANRERASVHAVKFGLKSVGNAHDWAKDDAYC